ncbi:MAG: SsrA-binding protein SmpB [Candidatus Omnitrophica bacterium]|nr:SsrA-binding protein SmpB [Candidatus Omnitrophota bacterium]
MKKNAKVSNKQAFRDFQIEETYEAGIELKGSEVKSIRAGRASLKGAFARVDNGEVFLYNMHITPYEFANEDIDPVRVRKLLLHHSQIHQAEVKISQKGYALVPLRIYFRRGYAKVELGIGKGKKLYDKRHDLKKKEADREMQRAMKHKNK